jgi:hypothetical protein
MCKTSLIKLGLATLIAASSLLATKPVHAAALCVLSYTHNGRTCTFVDSSNGCCHYVDQNGATCPPICGV